MYAYCKKKHVLPMSEHVTYLINLGMR